MIDRSHELPLTRQAAVLKLSRSGLYYRPAAGGDGRPGGDAADRRTASRLPGRGQPDAARSAMWRGCRDRPPARRDDDEAHGHHGDLPPAEHIQARAGPRDLPRISLRCVAVERKAETRRGRWTSRTCRWRVATSIWLPWSTGSAAGSWPRRLSITMEVEFCLEAVEEALAKHTARPEDLQHRPRLPVHQRRVHRCAADEGDRHRHGRQGIVAGQRVRRTPLANHQIRRGLLSGPTTASAMARASIGRYLDFYNRKRPRPEP